MAIGRQRGAWTAVGGFAGGGLDGFDKVSLLLPFLRLVQVDGIGRLYGTDFGIIGLILLLAPRKAHWFRSRPVQAFLVACVAYLGSAVASDIYNVSAFQDWIRGWSKIILFAASFVGLTLLFDGQIRRLVLFVLGMALSSLLEVTFLPDDFAVTEPWKFGYGFGITVVVIILAETDRVVARFGPLPGIVAVFGIGALSFSLNARSLFGLTAAAAALGLAKLLLDPTRRGLHLSAATFTAVLAVGGLLAYGMVELQTQAALSGMLGYEAEEKARVQTEGDLGILLGGRQESLVSTQAIADSPVFGHGSWARNISYVGLLVDKLTLAGIVVEPHMLDEDGIPSHSFLLGAWVENGVLAAGFWFWVLLMALRACKAVVAVPTARPMLAGFLIVSLMWDVLFSPFGADRRLSVPPVIILVLSLIEAERRQKAPDAARRFVSEPAGGAPRAAAVGGRSVRA